MKMRFFLALAMAAASCMVGCTTVRHNTPPTERLMQPGPGVGGPGPGVMAPDVAPASFDGAMGGGVIDGAYCGPEGGMAMGGGSSVQMLFNRPEGMEVHYDVIGDGSFGSEALYVPGRLEFPAGAIYRLKLTNIQGREGVELYPTVENCSGKSSHCCLLGTQCDPNSIQS